MCTKPWDTCFQHVVLDYCPIKFLNTNIQPLFTNTLYNVPVLSTVVIKSAGMPLLVLWLLFFSHLCWEEWNVSVCPRKYNNKPKNHLHFTGQIKSHGWAQPNWDEKSQFGTVRPISVVWYASLTPLPQWRNFKALCSSSYSYNGSLIKLIFVRNLCVLVYLSLGKDSMRQHTYLLDL